MLSASFGAVAGGLVGEWRARAAEKRQEQRDRSTTFRDRQLKAIEETRLDFAAANEVALYLAAGHPERAATVEHGSRFYPNAQIWLIGDGALILETMRIRDELVGRNGSGISEADTVRLGVLLGRANTALTAQADRIVDGKPPIYPPVAEVEAILRETATLHGIDQEMVDKIIRG